MSMSRWQADRENDLLVVHGVLMRGLVEDAGHYRKGGVGVMQVKVVIHMAPPADRAPQLMVDFLA